jgi:hypothetical protein
MMGLPGEKGDRGRTGQLGQKVRRMKTDFNEKIGSNIHNLMILKNVSMRI